MTTTQQVFDHIAALSAARSAMKESGWLVARIGRPADDLTHDLASQIWLELASWDRAYAFPTWATKVCSQRLIDWARAASTRKEAIMSGQITGEPDESNQDADVLLTDFVSKSRVVQAIDIDIRRFAEQHAIADDRDITMGMEGAVLALQRLRIRLIGEYLAIEVGGRRFSPTHILTMAPKPPLKPKE